MPTNSKDIEYLKNQVFDNMGPAYLLCEAFRFLAWNKPFEEIVATPFDLSIGDHATKFVNVLENEDEVLERTGKIFALGEAPSHDHEPLILKSEKYGLITFNKMAKTISPENPSDSCWLVYLNVAQCDKIDLLLSDILSG